MATPTRISICSSLPGTANGIFAWLELSNRRPNGPELDPPQFQSFLTAIDQSLTLRNLSGLPFYCQLMLTQFRETGLREFSDDVAMLKYAVDEIIKRDAASSIRRRVLLSHTL